MATDVLATQASGQGEASVRPYEPGWVDSLISWIHARPGPAWLSYLVLVGVGIVVSNSEHWLSGAPIGTMTWTQTGWGVFTILFLAAADYLNRLAGESFDTFRAALSPGRIDEARVRYELTVAPKRLSLVLLGLSFPLTFGYYVADPVASQVVGLSPVALVFRGAFEATFSGIILTIIAHALRQLRLVSRLHELADVWTRSTRRRFTPSRG